MEYEKMKKQADDEQSRIELRSEKVRNLIGQMPPFLIRWGNVILIVIVILLFLVGYCLYYSKYCSDLLKNSPTASIYQSDEVSLF